MDRSRRSYARVGVLLMMWEKECLLFRAGVWDFFFNVKIFSADGCGDGFEEQLYILGRCE